jgi:nicotinate phosphoribosyltransferase
VTRVGSPTAIRKTRLRVTRRLRPSGPVGVRLDSGDLARLARSARRMLDEAGLPDARIFASGSLDEYAIADLVSGKAPIDAYGVGTDQRPALGRSRGGR